MMAATNWIPTVLHLRNTVVDDQIAPDELHLLRLCPLAWLKQDRESRFLNMPTVFGPVDLKAKVAQDGETLEVSYSSRFREQPSKVVLHVPPLKGVRAVKVNGKTVDWDEASRAAAIR